MSLAKLVHLLWTRSLWYSRVDLLGDPYECTITEPMWRDVEDQNNETRARDGDEITDERFDDAAIARIHSYANCWCMLGEAADESHALWRIYGGSGEGGVAVTTTYAKLARVIAASDFIGLVQYKNFEKDRFERGNVFDYVMHKRDVFSYEHEVRIVRSLQFEGGYPRTWRSDQAYFQLRATYPLAAFGPDFFAQDLPPGLSVPIPIDELVEEIVVAPDAPEWFLQVVQTTVARFHCAAIVRWSSMRRPPRHPIIRAYGPRDGEFEIREATADVEPAALEFTFTIDEHDVAADTLKLKRDSSTRGSGGNECPSIGRFAKQPNHPKFEQRAIQEMCRWVVKHSPSQSVAVRRFWLIWNRGTDRTYATTRPENSHRNK